MLDASDLVANIFAFALESKECTSHFKLIQQRDVVRYLNIAQPVKYVIRRCPHLYVAKLPEDSVGTTMQVLLSSAHAGFLGLNSKQFYNSGVRCSQR